MAVAIRTITTLAAPFTQAQLSTALQTAFINAGFTGTFDTYTSGTDLILVYAYIVDSSKTFGTSYLRIRITAALVINQALYSTWNTATDTGLNPSAETAFTALVSTTSITFNAFSAVGEANLLLITQGTNFIPLGIIAPVNRRSSWDLNNWNWGFVFTSNTMLVLSSTTLNQYSNALNDINLAGSARLTIANPSDFQRDIFAGLILLNQFNQGCPGRTSDDLAIVCSNGSTRFDTFIKSGTSQQFTLLNPGNGGLAIRTA